MGQTENQTFILAKVWIIIIVITIIISIFAFASFAYALWRQNYNKKEWNIDKFPSISFPLRLLSSIGCGCTPTLACYFFFGIIGRTLIQPALKKSLQAMEKADSSGHIPKILCDERARNDMKKRIEDFKNDLFQSKSIAPASKVILFAGASSCLTHHRYLLSMADKVTEKEKVIEPVFIVSLPRTGTTILHRVLSLDRNRFRNFDLCDMIQPAPRPIPRDDRKGRERLAEKAGKTLNVMDTVFPGYKEALETMHDFRSGEADEDLGWYDAVLGHFYMDVLMLCYPEQRAKPGKISPLESKECAKYRYAWLHMIMRIYQKADNDYIAELEKETNIKRDETMKYSRDNEDDMELERLAINVHKPWLMKDPNHSAFLPELLAEFPDAKLIFSHRPPQDILPSLAKLFVLFTCVHFEPGAPGVTCREWGEESMRRMRTYVDGIVSFTREMEGTNYGFQGCSPQTSHSRIDLNFNEFRTDVIGAIEKIYRQFYPDNPKPSEEALKAFNDYLLENEREAKGNQKRSLEEFHLTKEDVLTVFREYNDFFLHGHENEDTMKHNLSVDFGVDDNVSKTSITKNTGMKTMVPNHLSV